MAKEYELRFLPLFEEDLNEIVDYITNVLQNEIAALSFVDAVEQAIRQRLPFAESFEKYQSTHERKYPKISVLSDSSKKLYHFLCCDWQYHGSPQNSLWTQQLERKTVNCSQVA